MEAIKFSHPGADDHDPKLLSDRALHDFLLRKNVQREMDVVEIYLANRDLRDLRPLKKFRNLSRLWLHSNKVSPSLDPLSLCPYHSNPPFSYRNCPSCSTATA